MYNNTKENQWTQITISNSLTETEKTQSLPSLSLCLLKNDKDIFLCDNKKHNESLLSFAIQAFIPFILAGCGMVLTGILFQDEKNEPLIIQIPEIRVLIIPLLGLKGNLEMTLASRLSTLVNLDLIKTRKQKLNTLLSNVALVQVQAIVISFIASILTILITLINEDIFDVKRATILIVTTISTASIASLILTTFIFSVTIIANNFGINPDNIATPFAAATGDFTTLFLLLRIGSFFCNKNNGLHIFNVVLIAIFLLSVIFWIWIATKNELTLQIIKYGWFAIILAVLISSCGGYVLYRSSKFYDKIELLQPLVNGAGGNLIAIQASKISTYLQSFGKQGILPMNTLFYYLNPVRVFFSKEKESSVACLLVLMCFPGHLIFICLIIFLKGPLEFTYVFYILYGIIILIQISLLLYICQFLTRLIWKLHCNPDNNSIPLLTSTGDLLGTILLTAVFYFNTLIIKK